MDNAIDMDAAVFGGGAAGLWTLDELTRAGMRCVLLEAHELGSGQTVASQGIIHGGMKYALNGMFSASARAIAEMPILWRECLAGDRQPDLSVTRLRSHFCYLWQTASLRSKLGMFGARAGLRVKPRRLEPFERPDLLREAVGAVARLDEQVIEPWSFVTALNERHRGRVMKIDVESGLEFGLSDQRSTISGQSSLPAGPTPSPPTAGLPVIIRLINPETGDPLDIRARHVIFAAGAGNSDLRSMFGLPTNTMQKRPLHMVMLRGGHGSSLPLFNGHCVDGAATRVTITSTRDFGDRPVWQIGGQISEEGVAMDERTLIARAHAELRAVLPALDLKGVQWATYRVDRAEAASGGARPNDATVQREGCVITAWPTKLALAPRMAALVRETIEADMRSTGIQVTQTARGGDDAIPSVIRDWPRPVVALPPWETTQSWTTLD